MTRAKTPVTLVTGYLGSGKTTLINGVLASGDAAGKKIGVLVNEFGAVGIDGALLAAAAGETTPGERVYELANGCLCCVVLGEFREALENLSGKSLDHVIVETSGAADPTSVLKLLWGAPELGASFRLDGVVCVADGERFVETNTADPVALLQASVADVVVITKTARAGGARVSAARELVARLNPAATVVEHEADLGAFPLEGLLGLDAYRKPSLGRLTRLPDATAAHEGLTSIAASWEGRVPRAILQEFFRSLALEPGVVRTKALLNVEGEKGAWLIQGVQSWIERTAAPRSYRGGNRLVILGRGLDSVRLESEIGRLRAASQRAP
ncbi:MAG: GTP-binding protein [Deltaproteobacteria bacterium]|nr:GTP-binding protein [Deltaproteobacteria bacterium]